MGLLFGLIVGPIFALAVFAPGSRNAFEKRREKFRAGQGRDPEKDFIGPHKSFAHNALFFAVVFGFIGWFAFRYAGF
jgi:hypothetical protein